MSKCHIVGNLMHWLISYPTLVDLTSNFFVLCTDMKVYLHNYSQWVEPSMNIHGGKGLVSSDMRF